MRSDHCWSHGRGKPRGVFAALRDPTAFAQVHCEYGRVEWPGDLDLAPETIRAEIRKSGRWMHAWADDPRLLPERSQER